MCYWIIYPFLFVMLCFLNLQSDIILRYPEQFHNIVIFESSLIALNRKRRRVVLGLIPVTSRPVDV